jgi:hypothetical protein
VIRTRDVRESRIVKNCSCPLSPTVVDSAPSFPYRSAFEREPTKFRKKMTFAPTCAQSRTTSVFSPTTEMRINLN